MHRLRVAALVSSFAIFAVVPSATSASTIIDFEGYPTFLSPRSTIPGIVVSLEGGIINETWVALVTGQSFPPGTVATSGTNLLGNLYGATLTITFMTPVREVSVETVGSFAGGLVGTITMSAFNGTSLVGFSSSNPGLIGDSGGPEDLLSLTPVSRITSLVFSSDVGGNSSFLLDDLTFTPIPEPTSCALVLVGLVGLSLTRTWRRRA